MTASVLYPILAIVVVTIVTALTRAVPFLLFGRGKRIPDVVQYVGVVLPASIMIILVIYCIRHIKVTDYPSGVAEILSVALVAGTQIWKKNTFLSIFVGTTCYMILIRTIFKV